MGFTDVISHRHLEAEWSDVEAGNRGLGPMCLRAEEGRYDLPLSGGKLLPDQRNFAPVRGLKSRLDSAVEVTESMAPQVGLEPAYKR